MGRAETRFPVKIGAGREGSGAGWRRAAAILGFCAGAAASAFVGGFLVFADQVTSARTPGNPHADGIVALTGGPRRIDDAVTLLSRGSAARLLISGVHETTSAAALAGDRPEHANLFACCIDIGHQALDTHGNALEAGEWARKRGYTSLIIVTSAFHMPRSLSEMQRAMPRVELVPYPVRDEERQLQSWPRDWPLFKLLFVEYVKYVAARLV